MKLRKVVCLLLSLALMTGAVMLNASASELAENLFGAEENTEGTPSEQIPAEQPSGEENSDEGTAATPGENSDPETADGDADPATPQVLAAGAPIVPTAAPTVTELTPVSATTQQKYIMDHDPATTKYYIYPPYADGHDIILTFPEDINTPSWNQNNNNTSAIQIITNNSNLEANQLQVKLLSGILTSPWEDFELTLTESGTDKYQISFYPSIAWDVVNSGNGQVQIQDKGRTPSPYSYDNTYGVTEPNLEVTIRLKPNANYTCSLTVKDPSGNVIAPTLTDRQNADYVEYVFNNSLLKTYTYTVTPTFTSTTGTNNNNNTSSRSSSSSSGSSATTNRTTVVNEVRGSEQRYGLGQGDSLTFTVEGISAISLQGVRVNNQELDAGAYSVREGSTILTLNPAYLDTLSPGNYTLTMTFWNYTANAQFTVVDMGAASLPPDNLGDGDLPPDNATQNPSTGLAQTTFKLFALAMLLCGASLAVNVLFGKNDD